MRSIEVYPGKAVLGVVSTVIVRWSSTLLVGAAIALALGCAPEEPQHGAVDAALGSEDLDSDQMKVALDEMLATTDILDRHRMAIRLLDRLDRDNLPGAIEAYEMDLARVDPHESRLFANAWAKIDPEEAVTRMLDWAYPKITFQSVEEAVFVWARSDDAASARAYVDPSIDSTTLKSRMPTKFMVMAVVKALGAAHEFDELTGLLESLDDDGTRELFITEVMIEMNRANRLVSVKDWIESMSWDAKNGLKVSALKRALDWSSKLSGPDAAKWYEEIEPQDPKSVAALPDVVSTWGVRAPDEAMVWLAERPESAVRNSLMRQMAIGWLSRKQEEAEVWLLANRESSPIMRDRLTLPLANVRVAQRRYPEAVALIEDVPNEFERNYAMAVALAEWAKLDKPAVDAYIVQNRVPESVVADMRKKLSSKIQTTRRAAKSVKPDSQDGDEG